MGLQFQQMVFTFNGGLNSKTDTFELTAPQLLQADNVRFQLDGSISKRPGFKPLSKNILGGGQLATAVACQVFNNELLAFDGIFIYSYVESVDAWVNRGLAISLINNQREVINTRVAQQNNPDGTSCNGQELYMWEDTRSDGEGIRYSVIDSATGSYVVSDVLLQSLAVTPKVVANDNTFFLYYSPSAFTLFTRTVSSSTPNLVSKVNHTYNDGAGPSNAAFIYDVTMYNGLPLLVYASNSGIKVVYNGASTVVSSFLSSITLLSVMVTAAGNIWISYNSANVLYVMTLNHQFNVTLSPTVVNSSSSVANIAMIEDITLNSCNLTYEITNTPNNNYIQNVVVKENGSLVFFIQPSGNPGNSQTLRSVGLASKPFKYNNQLFINTIYQSKNQSTYFCVCLTQQMKVISKMNPGVGGIYRNSPILAQCDPLSTDAGQFMFANQKKGAFQTNDNISYSLLGVNASYLDFTNVNSFNSAVGANNLHIVGAVEKVYDGFSVVEDNFHLYAENDVGSGCDITFTSGGQLQAGQYQYLICYEWTDLNNQVQRGQPSLPTIVMATAGEAAVLTIPTLRITDKLAERSPVSIAVFRTIIVNGVPSSIFYKVTTDSAPIINDATVDTLTFTDVTSDLQIAGNEPIYTTSQLYNQAPPACSLICPFLTRIFLSGLEDPNVIWTSQDRFELDNYNTIPVEFSPLLIEGINPTGDAITAMAELSGNAIIFKANTMYGFNGSGPNANGTSGGFSDATVISEDVGTVNPNSIIRIPANDFNSGGLMYQSNGKGIYLLDTNLINHYIGRNMEQFNNYHITSVELLNVNNEVVFITLEGTCLIYNYIFNRWSTWSYLPAVDSCIWKNKLTMIRADGTVLVQQDNYYNDYVSGSHNNNNITTKPIVRSIQIPWLAFAGLQGFQSVPSCLILGHYLSPHILNVSVLYDYDPAPKEPVSINSNFVSNVWGGLDTFGSGITFGGGQFTPYEFQYNIGYPWCKAISLLITDSPLSSNDQGGILSALTFNVGVFSDPVRLPVKNKFSGKKTPNGRYQ